MTTTLLMIRHGEHDLLGHRLAGRMTGVGLNAEGHRQAEKLGERLDRWPIGAVYAGPLQRAQETALPLARACNRPLETFDCFDEVDMGRWTGASFDALHTDPVWSQWNDRRGLTRCPGGESFVEVQARVAEGLDLFSAKHADQTIAVVSHSDTIKAAVAYFLGMPLDFHNRLEIAPASLTVAVYGGWGAKILKLNEEPNDE